MNTGHDQEDQSTDMEGSPGTPSSTACNIADRDPSVILCICWSASFAWSPQLIHSSCSLVRSRLLLAMHASLAPEQANAMPSLQTHLEERPRHHSSLRRWIRNRCRVKQQQRRRQFELHWEVSDC